MTAKITTEWVLWGFHPITGGGVPIKLTGGTLRQMNAAQRDRTREGGWTLAIYAKGTAPDGLIAQSLEAHKAARAAYEAAWSAAATSQTWPTDPEQDDVPVAPMAGIDFYSTGYSS